MENVLPSLITTIPRNSSHDCMVRAICEIAKTPENEDGLLGDFFNMLLTPWYVIENVSEHDQSDENDFLQAQRRGHFMQDCSAYEHNCAISIFEVCNISFFIGIVASIGPGARSSACRTIFAYSCVKYVKIENLTEFGCARAQLENLRSRLRSIFRDLLLKTTIFGQQKNFHGHFVPHLSERNI